MPPACPRRVRALGVALLITAGLPAASAQAFTLTPTAGYSAPTLGQSQPMDVMLAGGKVHAFDGTNVFRFDTDGTNVTVPVTFPYQGASYLALAIGPDGSFYAGQYGGGSGSIHGFTADGTPLPTILQGQAGAVYDMQFDADGALWVVDINSNTVFKVVDGQKVRTISFQDGKAPRYLDVDAEGNVWIQVASPVGASNQVLRFGPQDTVPASQTDLTGYGQNGLARDSAGNLFVAGYYDAFRVFDAAGTQLATWQYGQYQQATFGAEVDNLGHLYLADVPNRTIRKLDYDFVPPVGAGTPTVSGVAKVGEQLTAATGTWTGDPTAYAYAWERCGLDGEDCAAIDGATAATYTLVAADAGQTVRVTVTGSTDGSTASASSAATAVVADRDSDPVPEPEAPVVPVIPSVPGPVVTPPPAQNPQAPTPAVKPPVSAEAKAKAKAKAVAKAKAKVKAKQQATARMKARVKARFLAEAKARRDGRPAS